MPCRPGLTPVERPAQATPETGGTDESMATSRPARSNSASAGIVPAATRSSRYEAGTPSSPMTTARRRMVIRPGTGQGPRPPEEPGDGAPGGAAKPQTSQVAEGLEADGDGKEHLVSGLPSLDLGLSQELVCSLRLAGQMPGNGHPVRRSGDPFAVAQLSIQRQAALDQLGSSPATALRSGKRTCCGEGGRSERR